MLVVVPIEKRSSTRGKGTNNYCSIPSNCMFVVDLSLIVERLTPLFLVEPPTIAVELIVRIKMAMR